MFCSTFIHALFVQPEIVILPQQMLLLSCLDTTLIVEYRVMLN